MKIHVKIKHGLNNKKKLQLKFGGDVADEEIRCTNNSVSNTYCLESIFMRFV